MKGIQIWLMVFIMLILANKIFARPGQLVNSSFEDDRWITDISVKAPHGWDVNMPAMKFAGWVSNDWATQGSFSLILSSNWYTTFEANDMTTISQQSLLGDAKRLFFDLKLDTYPTGKIWDPNKRMAAILIDDQVVWKSDIFSGDIRGVHPNQYFDINISDRQIHTLSLALIADANEYWLNADTIYYVYWDNVGLDLACDGNGFLDGDFNRDCRVDMNDFCLLADLWLADVDLYSLFNLSHTGDVNTQGIINFNDYAIWAQGWDPNDVNDVNQLQEFKTVWLTEVPTDNAWNLYKADDIPKHGIIDADDLAIFVKNWLESSLP